LKEQLEWGVRVSRADHLIAISNWTAKDLSERLRVRPSKITTVYHGVDARLFNTVSSADAEIIRKYDLPARGFLCVSSDHYRKNHHTLFDAWSRHVSEIPEGLVFVGRDMYGRSLNEVFHHAQQRGLASRFRWLSAVEDSELPAIYRWARATIAPSLYEGFGMTLLESMACGTPVAIARNGVYEEVGGDAVIAFDGTSNENLGNVLCALSRDDSLHAELRERGIRHAAGFTWKRAAEQTLEACLRLVR
jgi:glycosyltransferase involved in cell wall biosynthesis